MKFKLFSGTRNGSLITIGIEVDDFEENKEEYGGAEGWFPSGSKDIEPTGEVDIIGDTHMFDDCFTVGADW